MICLSHPETELHTLWLTSAWDAGCPEEGGSSSWEGFMAWGMATVGVSGENSRWDPACTVTVLTGKPA